MANEANLAPLQLVRAYRAARRDFIAAAQGAGADAIARVHPERGPDGKPLFCDSAAFGPRHAPAAVIVIGGADGAVTALLKDGIRLPGDARLVVIDALDPFARAWGRKAVTDDWPARTLATIATEDLAEAKKLILLDLDGGVPEAVLKAALAQAQAKVSFRAVRADHIRQAVSAAIAAL